MMLRRRVAYSIAAALFVIACGRTELDQPIDDDGGPPGTGQAGRGGTTGVAGRGGGDAGGAGGSIGGSTGGPAGRGGTTGAGAIGGTTGVAGRGGTTGTAGRGGTTGAGATGGTTGLAGRGGTTGLAGRGGTTGAGAIGGTTGVAGRGGTTGVAGRGGFGGTGAVGGFGGTLGPVRVPCGQTTCTPVTEACCLQSTGAMCIKTGEMCPGGATIGCIEGSTCSAGNVCCLSLLGGATTCAPSMVCDFAGGVILCSSAEQCPSTAPTCCAFGTLGICRPMSCR